MTIDARKERFELVEVLGHPMLFTGLRVDRSTVSGSAEADLWPSLRGGYPAKMRG